MYFKQVLENFLKDLIAYAENPTPTMQVHLTSRIVVLFYAWNQEQVVIEKRITENVLKSLSVRLETAGAIEEIESLKKAIDNLIK